MLLTVLHIIILYATSMEDKANLLRQRQTTILLSHGTQEGETYKLVIEVNIPRAYQERPWNCALFRVNSVQMGNDEKEIIPCLRNCVLPTDKK